VSADALRLTAVSPVCGDGSCNGEETCADCEGDCSACPVCGDGACDATESCADCEGDCGACPVCGDGACDAAETCTACPDDCGACGEPPACEDCGQGGASAASGMGGAGNGGDDASGDGCACSAVGGVREARAGVWALLGLAAALVRRRAKKTIL
jgi:MYXO-CTERM domain-containing protein